MSGEGRRRRYVALLVMVTVTGTAAVTLALAVPNAIRFFDHAPAGFWAMALAALVVDIPLFGAFSREDPRVRSTLSICYTFAIFVLYGAAPAIVVQAIAGVVSVVGQRYNLRGVVYIPARLVLATAAAELVVGAVYPRPVTGQGIGLSREDLLAFLLLAVVWLVVSFGLLVAAFVPTQTADLRQRFSEVWADVVLAAAAVLVVAPLLVAIRGWWSLLVVVPVMLWNQLTREQLRREQEWAREPETGLLNRRGLVAGVRSITAHDSAAPQALRPFGIILVAFESALAINRTLGRELYEKVVGVASSRLIDVYGGDRAARLSGEAIAILVPDLTEPDALAATEAALAVLDPPVEVDEISFALDAAAGVALSPQHGRDLSDLLMKAELTAAEARRTGQRVGLYVSRATELAQRRIVLLRELHTVLRDPVRHHEIAVLYQPQIDLGTGRLAAVEALLRWTHPQWGPIPADILIESIEPSEIMHELTAHVLGRVAEQMHRWNEQGEPLRVSVNVSVQDLHRPDFVAELGRLVDEHGIAPGQLAIEITERMLISDIERVSLVARALAERGLGLSLDDFGTGYASLQQLRQLPLREVKLDRSYISGVVDNPTDRAIVASVHQLARALGVDVVAEGVEDEGIAQALAELPGVIGQGWYFGRPMSAEELCEWCQLLPRPVSDRRRFRRWVERRR
ncbi:MAG: GGDEF domain-containing protein [Micromonosporaceae bacterium]|nr:GGDEF domain-containing protein [Micromonosporaceae bacterium]